jgi:quercetin dioxygenase-like cupin family protein
MNVIDIHGITVDAVVGPEHGATRLFIWCVTAEAGQAIGMHHHDGEELFRVLYGRLRFRVGDNTREVSAGEVVIIPPGTRHGYVALENSEVEILGEIGAGEFITVRHPDGSSRDEEQFVRGHPWSRVPADESLYSTEEELLERYRASLAADPIS